MIRKVVCGAPCAGKSSYVKERAAPGELIYDYDLIHQALSGQGSHEHLIEIRDYVIAAREAIFHQLEAHESQAAWIITSSSKRAEIEHLSERFGAEIIFLAVDQDEAHQRADRDQRPEAWHDYIDNWFDNSDIEPGFLLKCKIEGEKKIMNKKTFKAPMVLKKDGNPGEFEAIFATLNVKDLDGDVTIPGAFIQGQEVIIEPWNHGYTLPAGKGKIYSDQEKAWIEGAFFMDTETGVEHYKTVKNMGSLSEWSYTFDVLEQGSGQHEEETVNFLRSLDTVGVAPVTRGAGIDTRTVSIKNQKSAIRSHSTPTSEGAWDGPANEARAKSGEELAYYAKIFAWRDPDGSEGAKSSYKFIHHEISAEGDPGAANVKACQSGIGVLNGGMGGTTIPESDRSGVYNHLAKHLRDADLEPPALKSLEELAHKSGEDPGESIKPRDQLINEINIQEIKIKSTY